MNKLFAVKYCGGCNSRYDRVAAHRMLEQKLGALPAAKAGEHYAVIFVLCGCTACCADISGVCADKLIWISEQANSDLFI